METPHSVQILNLTFVDGAERLRVPCLILDGQVSRPVLAWIISEAKTGATPSSLERYAQSMRRFTEYYLCFGQEQHGEALIRRFSMALEDGCPALGWSPLAGRTADNYFSAVNQFCDWLVLQPGFEEVEHPNPEILVSMSPSERATAEARSQQTSMLHHLYSLTKQGQGLKPVRKVQRRKNRYKRSGQGIGCLDNPQSAPVGFRPLGMTLDEFWRLLETEKNPRNRIVWLLLGAGGLRVSEALNMFATDVFFQNSTQQALIALANPVEGSVLLPDGSRMMRAEYLRQRYSLISRCLLPKSDPLHAGWKGIMEDGLRDDSLPEIEEWSERRWVLVEWLLPVFGRMFWRTHLEYMAAIRGMRPKHPYYIVNMARNAGEPVTRSGVVQCLATACRRAGIKVRRPHRLRHMYGNCLADWGIPLSTAQVMMRHASPASTLVYYRASRSVTRKKLMEAEQLSLRDRQALLTARQQALLPDGVQRLLPGQNINLPSPT